MHDDILLYENGTFSVAMFKCLKISMSCILRMDSYHNHSWPLLFSLKTSSFQMRSLSLSPKCISNFHASQMIHSIWYEISLTSRCIRLVYMRRRYKKNRPAYCYGKGNKLVAVLTMTNDVYFSKSYFNTDGMSWAHHFLFWNVYTVNGRSYTILFCLFLFCMVKKSISLFPCLERST